MKSFSSYYLRTFCLKDIAQRIKLILFLSVIFILSFIFSVIVSFGDIHRADFLNSCEFQNYAITDKDAGRSVPFFTADAICTEKASANSVRITVFDGKAGDSALLFAAGNQLNGSFSGKAQTVWLTMNTAYEMGVGVGDKVEIEISDAGRDRSFRVKDYLVDGIIKPFGGDINANEYDENQGFANVFFSESDEKQAVDLSEYYLIFDVADAASAISKEMFFAQEKLKVDYLGNRLKLWFPIFSVVLTFALVSLEYEHYYRRSRRRLAVLYALGGKVRGLRWIQTGEFCGSMLIATIISGPVARFMMARALGKYMPITLTILICGAELILSCIAYLLFRYMEERRGIVGVLFNDISFSGRK